MGAKSDALMFGPNAATFWSQPEDEQIKQIRALGPVSLTQDQLHTWLTQKQGAYLNSLQVSSPGQPAPTKTQPSATKTQLSAPPAPDTDSAPETAAPPAPDKGFGYAAERGAVKGEQAISHLTGNILKGAAKITGSDFLKRQAETVRGHETADVEWLAENPQAAGSGNRGWMEKLLEGTTEGVVSAIPYAAADGPVGVGLISAAEHADEGVVPAIVGGIQSAIGAKALGAVSRKLTPAVEWVVDRLPASVSSRVPDAVRRAIAPGTAAGLLDFVRGGDPTSMAASGIVGGVQGSRLGKEKTEDAVRKKTATATEGLLNRARGTVSAPPSSSWSERDAHARKSFGKPYLALDTADRVKIDAIVNRGAPPQADAVRPAAITNNGQPPAADSHFSPEDLKNLGRPVGIPPEPEKAPVKSAPPAPPADDHAADAGEEPAGERDALYGEALRVVMEVGKASTSTLQRRLRLSYGRAARILDMMYRDGIIGPPDGSKPREILKKRPAKESAPPASEPTVKTTPTATDKTRIPSGATTPPAPEESVTPPVPAAKTPAAPEAAPAEQAPLHADTHREVSGIITNEADRGIDRITIINEKGNAVDVDLSKALPEEIERASRELGESKTLTVTYTGQKTNGMKKWDRTVGPEKEPVATGMTGLPPRNTWHTVDTPIRGLARGDEVKYAGYNGTAHIIKTKNGRQLHVSKEDLERLLGDGGGAVKDAADKIFTAMNRIAFSPGTTVTFYRLRQQPELADIPKDVFDKAAMLLQSDRRALLSSHGHAPALPESERAGLVTDGHGGYYTSIYNRDPNGGNAVAEQPAKAAVNLSAKLPADLAGAKPKYKTFGVEFKSDIDRAAYITAQQKRSPKDAQYLKFVMDSTGMSEDEVREYGKFVRSEIKKREGRADDGYISVPSLYAKKPEKE